MTDDLHGRWLRGLLEACVLCVLQSEPAYGYDIASRFEEIGFPRPKGGTLYPILARLEDEALVEPTWVEGDSGPSRKYYQLTAAGSAAVETIKPEWRSFVQQVTALLDQSERTTA
jgi:PadR family transcriptional regulator PadR